MCGSVLEVFVLCHASHAAFRAGLLLGGIRPWVAEQGAGKQQRAHAHATLRAYLMTRCHTLCSSAPSDNGWQLLCMHVIAHVAVVIPAATRATKAYLTCHYQHVVDVPHGWPPHANHTASCVVLSCMAVFVAMFMCP